jgi:hypothetical protein
MKKVARRVILILLATVMLALPRQIPSSKAELKSEMPVVFVEPQNAFAAVGTTFNISVKIFNLTNNFYQAGDRWYLGQPLPTPGSRYNYSLGNMYGFSINFSWNPAVLEYVGHVVTTPAGEYPDGVLNWPLLQVKEDINSTAGTYSVAQNSDFFVEGFICPERNATVFVMTFKVKMESECPFRLERVELIVDPVIVNEGCEEMIPTQTLGGVFTSAEMTRINGMDVGALIDEELLTPIILGENATVRILVTNGGATMDSYNLTLFWGSTPLKTWEGENLTSQEEATYNYTLRTRDLGIGRHVLTAKDTVLHDRTRVVDWLTANFTVIATPLLSITVLPNDVYVNDTAILSAENSFHQDPNSQIVNYKWVLYEPNSIFPIYYEGVRINYTFAENGTWRIMLIVTDNWGITHNISRNATEPYSKTILLDVHAGSPPPPQPPDSSIAYEQIIIVVACLIIIVISIAVYKLREKHR